MNDSPRRNGIKQSLRHPDQLRVTDGMNSGPARGARNDIQFTHCVALPIFTSDLNTAFFLCDSPESTVDDNVEAVTSIVRAP